MATSDFIIAEFQESPIPKGSPRFVRMPATAGKPGVVIGMRRVGKTYLMYQRMRELVTQTALGQLSAS